MPDREFGADVTGEVKLPAHAVDSDATSGNDVVDPAAKMLGALSLLPKKADLEKDPWRVITGPPASLSIIEAGATAASKWWAGGAGATVIAAWVSIRVFYDDEPNATQRMLWLGAAIVTAAAILSVAYVIASDVRGRAAAMVATIEARSALGVKIVSEAGDLYTPASGQDSWEVLTLPSALDVQNGASIGSAAEAGWKALLMRSQDATTEYYLVKENQNAWVPADQVIFI